MSEKQEIKKFDDTSVEAYHRIGSLSMLLGMKSRFLMILYIAEYHQFWGFQAAQAWNPGF
jgi:hypothetical protein